MTSFKLHSDNSEFNSRVDALFDCLQTAAVDLKPSSPSSAKRSWDDENSDLDTEGECSTISVGRSFRKPRGLPPRWRQGGGRGRSYDSKNTTPDYVTNPQNWTRYSMKDTKVSSDRENKRIGLELYEELRSRKCNETDKGAEESCPKVIFKKPVRTENKSEDGEEQVENNAESFFGGTKKFRMKEYEVGTSKQKPKPKVTDQCENGKENKKDIVKLDYLSYEDEEDGE